MGSAPVSVGSVVLDPDVFPDPAASLLTGNRPSSFVKEVGNNYRRYHDALAEQFAKVGEPRPEQFETPDEYLAAFARQERILAAEVIIRAARANVEQGVPLVDLLPAGSPPLWRDARLVPLIQGRRLGAHGALEIARQTGAGSRHRMTDVDPRSSPRTSRTPATA